MNGLIFLFNTALNLTVVNLEQSCSFDSAIQSFNNSKNQEALNQFRLCLKDSNHDIQSRFYLGIVNRRMGQYDEAVKQLKSILGRNKNNVNYYLEYAYTFEKSGQIDKALKAYTQTVNQHPQSIPALLGVARMNHWLGNINESIFVYEKLKLQNPDNIAIKLGLAFALLSDRKLQKSKLLFTKVLKEEKNNKSAQDGLAMIQKANNHSLNYSSNSISFGDKSTKAHTLSYVSTPDFSLKWGAQFINYQNPIDSFSIEAVSTNRFVLNEISVFAAYKTSQKNELLIQLVNQDLFNKNNLYKLKLEDYYSFKNNHQISAGITQSYSDSQLTNTLSTIGHTLKKKNNLEILTRFYYSSDKPGLDSQSLSSSFIKTTKQGNSFQLGVNLNRYRSKISSTAFGKVSYKVNPNTSFSASAAKNKKDQYTQYSFGINYEF